MNRVQQAQGVWAKDLSWRYQGSTIDALAGVTLALPAGSVTLVTGESGSGKSTFGALLAGLLDPLEDGEIGGELRVGESSAGPQEVPVGVVLQQPDDQTILHRVGDDVAFGLENLGVEPATMTPRIVGALEAVGLEVSLDHPTEQLSGGQRQRLAMAGAIAMRPGLMVLDEPLQALDEEGQLLVVASVTRLHRQGSLSLVIVDHDPQPWRDLVDTVVVFDSGRLAGVWSPESAPIQWERATSSPRRRAPTPGDVVCSTRDLVIGRKGITLEGEHSLECRAGEILALVGPNGSGKSTLAQTLAGLIPPHAGQVTTPADPHLLRSVDLASAVAYVPQNPDHHAVGQTVWADVEATLVAKCQSESERVGMVSTVVERYALESIVDRHPQSLSGGESRRVALAGAVVTGAPLIILDEPSQSLDARAWTVLVDNLRHLAASGKAIIVATHDRALIAALGAREYSLSAPTKEQFTQDHDTRPRWLSRANPLSLFVAATVIAIGLLASLDVVSSAVALGGIVCALALSGAMDAKSLLRLLPIGLAALFAGVTIALYGEQSGDLIWEWALIVVTEGSLALALATALRVMAIATPAVVLFRDVDATAFADALSQKLRLPERFVVGALAGVRLVQVLGHDLTTVRMTRRSRGLGDRRKWIGVAGEVFSLVVIALRRARVLATAMEARAFGRDPHRTHYRVSRWSAIDAVIVTVALCIVLLALASALLSGTWSP